MICLIYPPLEEGEKPSWICLIAWKRAVEGEDQKFILTTRGFTNRFDSSSIVSFIHNPSLTSFGQSTAYRFE